MDRRLAAILAMDMVGYSRLMEGDEEGTLARQTAHFQELINPSISEHRGRVVKTTGDGLLAEFPSAVDAVECAVEIQRRMPDREVGVDKDRRIFFRIGINVGDVVFQDGDIYGDGVNVAARIEPLADPGGICISQGVFNAVRKKVEVGFEDVGLQSLKNISEPVQVYRVLLAPDAVGKLTTGRLRKPAPVWRQPAYIAAATVIVVLGGGLALRDAIVGLPSEGSRRVGAAALEQAGEVGDPRRIAILYLEDESGEGDLGYVADGLTEGLIDELSTVSALQVVSRNGSLQFKDSDLPRDSIARALRVGTVVSGSVDHDGDGIRVDVVLSEGLSGTEFRRGSFEGSQEEILDLQSSLVTEVSELLRVWLNQEIQLRQSVGETENVAAWALVQRGERERKEGEALLRQGEMDGQIAAFHRADSLLAEAETMDPGWPRPVVMRAQLALRSAQLTAANPREATGWVEAGFHHVERALKLDPRNAEALETRGILSYVMWVESLETDPSVAAGLLARAEEDLEAAVDLEPTLANAWNILSVVHSQKPDLIEAKISARRALEEDAFLQGAQSILWRLYATSYDLEQFPDAVQYCDEGKRRFPDNPRFSECELWLLASRALEPDVDKAWELLEQMDAMESPETRELRYLMGRMVVGGVLARANMMDSADAVWVGSRGNPEVDPALELLGFEAVFRLQVGQEDEAMELLKTYLTASPGHREGWRWTSHWWWRGIQDHPDFRRLMGSDATR